MLELIDLTYTYPKAKNAEALTDASCRIGEGTWLLLGENGAGKTTLKRLAASLLRPTSGQVILDGEENVTAHEGVDSEPALPADRRHDFPGADHQ